MDGVPAGKSFCSASMLQLVLIYLLWAGLVAGAYLMLLTYAQVPGPSSMAPQVWPAASQLKRAPGQFTLITFAHPKCPCTTATITELAVLMARCRRLQAYVVFLEPRGFSREWIKSSTWYQASNIPGVTVLPDDGGLESGRFGASTSGETLVYNPAGQLVFCGGITAARGHEGDNQGLDAIELVADTNVSTHNTTPVFGCSLADNPDPNGLVFREVFKRCFK